MTKGTKIFRIIVSVILVLTAAWTVILTTEVYDLYKANKDDSFYGIVLEGVKVTSKNQDDILGDGTVLRSYYSWRKRKLNCFFKKRLQY